MIFGSMEGKEVCFGVGGLLFFVVFMMVVLNGVVNVMYDSLILFGGLVLMFFM